MDSPGKVVMPKDFEYFPLYVHRLLSSLDVRRMRAADFGAYMLLLIESFVGHPQGYLPDDEEELQFLARMSDAEWAKSGANLMKKFQKRQGNLIYNPTMVGIIKDLKARRAKCVSAGKAGADKRWNDKAEPQPGHSDANGEAIETPPSKHSNRTKTKTKIKTKKKTKSLVRPTPQEVEAYAESRGFDLEGEHFCDYQDARGWILKSGQAMVDWKATVRTWQKNEQGRAGSSPNVSSLQSLSWNTWADARYDIDEALEDATVTLDILRRHLSQQHPKESVEAAVEFVREARQ